MNEEKIIAENSPIERIARAMWAVSYMASKGVPFENEDRVYFIRLALAAIDAQHSL